MCHYYSSNRAAEGAIVLFHHSYHEAVLGFCSHSALVSWYASPGDGEKNTATSTTHLSNSSHRSPPTKSSISGFIILGRNTHKYCRVFNGGRGRRRSVKLVMLSHLSQTRGEVVSTVAPLSEFRFLSPLRPWSLLFNVGYLFVFYGR